MLAGAEAAARALFGGGDAASAPGGNAKVAAEVAESGANVGAATTPEVSDAKPTSLMKV
jgi:hypothetical protein